MGHNVSKGKIAYILNSFPKLSETFILNEIWELKQKGVDILLVAMNRSAEEVVHARAETIAPEVTYFDKLGKRRKFENAVIAGFLHPLRLVRTLSFIWEKYESARFWKLKQALYLGGELIRNGIGHVHAHFAMEAAEMAMLAGTVTGIPYSMHPHALDIYVHPKMLKEKMRHAKFVSTECDFNKKYLHEYFPGYPEEKIVVIRLGIDLTTFSAKPINTNPHAGESRNSLMILVCGQAG